MDWQRPRTVLAIAPPPGTITLAPPSATSDLWTRRFPDPVTAFASGWMRVRARARQRGVELPLVISDHADWDELLLTIEEVQAPEIWVTHGREEALIHAAGLMGKRQLSEAGDEIPQGSISLEHGCSVEAVNWIIQILRRVNKA